MREEDLLVDFLLRQGRAAAIAQKVLGGGSHALPETLGLKAFDKGGTHGGGKVSVLAVGFLHAGPVGAADDVHHRRQGELLAQVAHRTGSLLHLHGEQRGIPGAGDGHLLGIGRGALGRHASDALVVDDGRDAGRGVVDHIILDIGNQLAQFVRIQTLGAGQLADVAGAVWNQFLALLQGENAVYHQLARVDSKELGGPVFHREAVIDSIHQRLILFVRVGSRLRGTGNSQQDGQRQEERFFHILSKD